MPARLPPVFTRKLVSSRQAINGKVQHTHPCGDCPMARAALPGWLGGYSPDEWLLLVHSEAVVPCHVIKNMQCAGTAIYRANIVKRCVPPNLKLPKDDVKVFATPMEFKKHHGKE